MVGWSCCALRLQVYPALRADLAARLRMARHRAPLSLAEIDPGLPNRTLDAYCRRRTRVPCLDVTDALVKASQESPAPLYKQRDTHWTVRGNRVAAETEAASLVPLVCPRVSGMTAWSPAPRARTTE